MLIYAFCKIYEPERKIVLVTKIKTKTILGSGLQLLQNPYIIKQTVLLLWKN